jgi:hypothetical protein
MKKKKKILIISPVLPVNRLIEPEILGGDKVQPDLSDELSFKIEDIPISPVPDLPADPPPVPEGKTIIKMVRFPQWG